MRDGFEFHSIDFRLRGSDGHVIVEHGANENQDR
jgi:hypothetical protein